MDRVIMISQAKKIESDYIQVLLFSFRKLSRYSGPKSTKKYNSLQARAQRPLRPS